jgi:hypothetical protein
MNGAPDQIQAVKQMLAGGLIHADDPGMSSGRRHGNALTLKMFTSDVSLGPKYNLSVPLS